MKLTVLIENKPAPGRPELAAEHGLSVLVETEAGRVLLDLSGEERRRMTVPGLLEAFGRQSGRALDNDRMLLEP